MTKATALMLLAGPFLIACEETPQQAVGQLESDRVELVAESTEPITAIPVTEGEAVDSSDLILQQDPSRLQIRVEEAQANIARIRALLQEQLNGPRRETIAATRASLNEAVIERDYRQRELQRLEGLRARDLTSAESLDTARKLLESAGARIEFVTAQLEELEAGTRVEQIDQTRAQLLQAQAQLSGLEFDRSRLSIRSPVPGVIDSLPFEIGERPRIGDVVAVMLTGEQPYARIYIPEPLRLGVNVGDTLEVHIDGMEGPVSGRVRRLASEPGFTPYFALTERDRSRLSYLAEVALPAGPRRLPEGLPVQVLFE